MRATYLSEIRSRIQKAEPGAVFIPSDFFDVAESVKVNMCLKRLKDSGELQPVIHGIYAKPWFSQLLNTFVPPRTEDVAHAIARNHNWSIVPCGDTALNLLGLSTQVPAVYLYISDGPYRTYKVGNLNIQFKHSTQKNVTGLSPTSALVVQALKALGAQNVDDSIIQKLRTRLSPEIKMLLLSETKQSTAWIYEIIKQVCRQG